MVVPLKQGRVRLAISGSHTYNELCQIHMGHLQCFRRDKKSKEGRPGLKDGPGKPMIAASKANMPFHRDYSGCQETPTFCLQ